MFDKNKKYNISDKYLIENFDISKEVIDMIREAEKELEEDFNQKESMAEYNQYKVLEAFQKNRISDNHFAWNTGYGYDDAGRKAVEDVYKDVFKAERTLVRTNIVNGTHALAITLMGILRPGDELIYATGKPYDTLEEVIGIRGEGMGSLKEYGVSYNQIELKKDGKVDFKKLREAISSKTKMISMQRATGYDWRTSITIEDIREVAKFVHDIRDDIVVMVDNCYGEFLETREPIEVGADVMAGSLIKNPGGGLALSGGYVAGKKELIEKISYRMTCPGIGDECGLTFGQTRAMLQGLFMAPEVVKAAVKGAMLCGKVYENLGYKVCPRPEESRSDIIQGINLGTEEAVINFCEGIQFAAPIDSFVSPVPWDMPGYEDKVIMAAGAFVQGSSIELSADAPLREPYNVYFQGGLTYSHSRFGILKATDRLYKKGLLNECRE